MKPRNSLKHWWQAKVVHITVCYPTHTTKLVSKLQCVLLCCWVEPLDLWPISWWSFNPAFAFVPAGCTLWVYPVFTTTTHHYQLTFISAIPFLPGLLFFAAIIFSFFYHLIISCLQAISVDYQEIETVICFQSRSAMIAQIIMNA